MPPHSRIFILEALQRWTLYYMLLALGGILIMSIEYGTVSTL